MKFNINEKQKKRLKNEMIKTSKCVHITCIIEKIIAFSAIFGPLIFFAVNALDPNAFMGDVRGEWQKNYEVLFFLTIIPASGLYTTWLFVWVLRLKLSSAYLSERVEESLELIDSKLFYSFRIKYQSNPDERNIVVIDLASLEKVDYNEKSKKMIVQGKIVEKLIKLGKRTPQIDMSDAQMGEIVIYDYFEPSLREYLKEK